MGIKQEDKPILTFNQIYSEAQAQVEDVSADSLTLIKRAINQGAKQFGAILRREWRITHKTFSTVASQQFYQTPEDCIRVKSITISIGGVVYPLREVPDDITWQKLNMTSDTSNIPEFFYVKGNDEFGIYPIPSSNGSNAGTLAYERRMRDMSVADYATGTVTMTNASAAVTGSGTTFTQLMVGRSLKIDDANGDGMWYKIATYTSATSITLENTYGGLTGATLTYSIGELPDIPEEFHESLVDYACYRYYRRRKDVNAAREMKSSFVEALGACQANYSSKTTSMYIRPIKMSSGYHHARRNYTVS